MVTKTIYFISLTQHNFLTTLSICRPLKSAARGGRPVAPPPSLRHYGLLQLHHQRANPVKRGKWPLNQLCVCAYLSPATFWWCWYVQLLQLRAVEFVVLSVLPSLHQHLQHVTTTMVLMMSWWRYITKECHKNVDVKLEQISRGQFINLHVTSSFADVSSSHCTMQLSMECSREIIVG